MSMSCLFLILRFEFEEFFFKNLFKESFLRTNKEIYKYTEGRKSEDKEYTQYLESNWASTVGNITYYPDNNTEPDNKEIYYDTSQNHIRIHHLQKLRVDKIIHRADYILIIEKVKSESMTF